MNEIIVLDIDVREGEVAQQLDSELHFPRVKEKLHHIHIADSNRLPPGQGVCNYDALLKALKEIDYQGYLSMEVGFHTRSADPDWYALTSIEYLRSKLKEIQWG